MTSTSHCWREIGSAGDRTCPKLAHHLLCGNCEVFADAARSLLERPGPDGYIDEWTRWLAAPPVADTAEELSLCPFRLGDEWFALPTSAFSETLESRSPRRIPHRRSEAFLGLINVRGELVLCFSLSAILAVSAARPDDTPTRPRRPLIFVCGEGRHRFAFPVDDAVGVWRVAAAALHPPPATVGKAEDALTAGLVELAMGTVALLDSGRLARTIEHLLQ
ncbi:MAG: chemotaxis protein CheW [Gammaproteobacteria bacterium]|nr:chemotaxis protein CheW [Gammaproteobacteria bacterium]